MAEYDFEFRIRHVGIRFSPPLTQTWVQLWGF